MAKMSELLGGLFVQIERVDAENFPEVKLEVRVQNRKRQNVVGLKAENFYLTEQKRPCGEFKFEGTASESQNEDIVIIVDRSMYMNDYSEPWTDEEADVSAEFGIDEEISLDDDPE